MPAILKVVYSINPALDLTEHDDFTIVDLMHTEYGTGVAESLVTSINQLIQQGVTDQEQCHIEFNRPARTFTIDRPFTTLAAAADRKTWIEANIPASTANFTRSVLETTDNATVANPGTFTI